MFDLAIYAFCGQHILCSLELTLYNDVYVEHRFILKKKLCCCFAANVLFVNR